MSLNQPPPLASLPDLTESETLSVLRCQRVFGNELAINHAKHLKRIRDGKPWFVSIDKNGARYFTHFKKLDRVVKNARSMTGSQKFIAKNDDNWGIVI